MPITVTPIGIYTLNGIPGVQFVKSFNTIYPLTKCCQATAKGSDGCVVCRKCYREVDPIFGMAWTEDEFAIELPLLKKTTVKTSR
jgi:hypothetical protein